MELIDRLIVSNDVFIKSILAQFAKTRKLPASAVSEMQCAGVVRELFGTLGATDDMAMEYIHTVLGRMPAHARKRIKPSESLLNFMDNRVDPGLLHKYHLAPEELYINWTFDSLEDVSELEHLNLGASVECEHHERWKHRKKEDEREAAKEPTPKKQDAPEVGKPSEVDSLLEL